MGFEMYKIFMKVVRAPNRRGNAGGKLAVDPSEAVAGIPCGPLHGAVARVRLVHATQFLEDL